MATQHLARLSREVAHRAMVAANDMPQKEIKSGSTIGRVRRKVRASE